jgi:hypothetical protein
LVRPGKRAQNFADAGRLAESKTGSCGPGAGAQRACVADAVGTALDAPPALIAVRNEMGPTHPAFEGTLAFSPAGTFGDSLALAIPSGVRREHASRVASSGPKHGALTSSGLDRVRARYRPARDVGKRSELIALTHLGAPD